MTLALSEEKSEKKKRYPRHLYTTEKVLRLAGNTLFSLCPKRLNSLAVIHGSICGAVSGPILSKRPHSALQLARTHREDVGNKGDLRVE